MKPLRIRLARLDTGLSAIAALALALYLVFLIVPVLLSLKTSFTNQNILFPDSSFVGLANYRQMLHDTALRASIEFTLDAGGHRHHRGQRRRPRFRDPAQPHQPQLPGAAHAGVPAAGDLRDHRRLRLELDALPDGLVNHILTGIGLVSQPVNWLGTPQLAQLSAAHRGVLGAVRLHHGRVPGGAAEHPARAVRGQLDRRGEQPPAVPDDHAAAWWRPPPRSASSSRLITVLKLYDIITALTGGGPAFATRSIAMYIISVGFSNDAYGYASAIAMVLLVADRDPRLVGDNRAPPPGGRPVIAPAHGSPPAPSPNRAAPSRPARAGAARGAPLGAAGAGAPGDPGVRQPDLPDDRQRLQDQRRHRGQPRSLPVHPTLRNLSRR